MCKDCGIFPTFYQDFKGYNQARYDYPDAKLGWQLICFQCGQKLVAQGQEELVEAWNLVNVAGKVDDIALSRA
jgi:hypothetical protein